MSLLPVLVNELLDDYINPLSPLYDQHFGLGIQPRFENVPRLTHVPLYSGYVRPWRHHSNLGSGVSSVENTKDEFKVSLDVQQFKPEEINVKLQGDYLVVDGKHEERQDKHGFISRQFQRRYKLPEGVDADKVKSSLSTDGVLCLHAPKKTESLTGERNIPIEATNKPALNKQPTQEAISNDKMES